MNKLDILCFASIARTQSFSATARELRITQQAVSRHIRSLEDELGFDLFLRSYQNVHLTRAGERMLAYFEQQEQLMQEIFDHFRADQTPPLRIAWSQWIGAPDWFRQTIVDFQAAEPEVRLAVYDLDAPEMSAALNGGQVDILLTTRYAAEYLPVFWDVTELGRVPIMLIGNRRVSYDFSNCSLFPFFAASAGECNEAAILARVRRECERSSIYPKNIEICPNMGSACLNTLVRGGLMLGVNIPPMAQTSEFVLHPTGQYASVVLCRPLRGKRPEAERFEKLLLERMEAVK